MKSGEGRNSLQETRGRNWSRSHGGMLFTGVFPTDQYGRGIISIEVLSSKVIPECSRMTIAN